MLASLLTQLKKDPLRVARVGAAYMRQDMSCGAHFYTSEQLLEQIRLGKSIIRLGDGDLGVMHGKDIFHQTYDQKLETRLWNIVREYSDNSPYILFIPKFINIPNSILRAKNVLICWLPFKVEYVRSFNRRASYGDAHSFYYLDITRDLFDTFIKKHDVLFVANKAIIKKLQENDLDESKLSFVETPELGTFDILDEITLKVDAVVQSRPNVKIVFACGSSSRVLAHRYALQGVQSLDLGRGINCYLDNKDYSDTIWATKITTI